MDVQFTHCCPFCQRKRRLSINHLGMLVGCLQCGRTSTATDPSNESLAMMDSIKHHAELSTNPSLRQPAKLRAPR